MKEVIFIILFSISAVAISQSEDKKNRFEYKSFSVSPFFNIYSDSETGGIVFSGDLSYSYNSDIFTLSLISGAEFSVLGSGDDFEEINILYGRELQIRRKLFIDIHTGLGYFSFSPSSIYETRKTTIGVPLITKLRLKTGKRFSIGLQLHANMNSANTIYSAGILLQWNKKNKN